MKTTSSAPIAFYDFDGTLVSGNIVTRYAFFVRRLPERARSHWKLFRLLAGIPGYLMLDYVSRRRFNLAFFKEYRGMRGKWLASQAQALFEELIFPSIYQGAKELVDADRAQGFRPFLVSGELDFILGPVIRHFGFDGCISNSLVFERGVATGEVILPLIAEDAKVDAIKTVCAQQKTSLGGAKGYSDSFSDLPMLEAVGAPCAVNPDKRLRAAAADRGWPIRELRKTGEEKSGPDRGNHVHIS